MSYSANWLYDPAFEADDPRAWRNECANPGSTAHLSDILNEWKNNYEQLELIGLVGGDNRRGPLHADGNYPEEYKVRIDLRPLSMDSRFDLPSFF